MNNDQPPSGNLSNAAASIGQSSARLPSPADFHDLPGTQYDYQSTTGPLPSSQSPFQLQLAQQQHLASGQSRTNQQNAMHLDQTQTQRFVSPMNMGSLASALPDGYSVPTYSQQTSQRFPGAVQTPALLYQMQQPSPYSGQTLSSNPSYHLQQQGMYGAPHLAQQGMHPGGNQPFFPSQSFLGPPQVQQMAPYFYNQTQFSPHAPHFPASSYTGHFTNRNSIGSEGGLSNRQKSNERVNPGAGPSATVHGQSGPLGSSQSSVPRGPPRKPKQSGHALWVGNLPPGANVVDLKDHFSRDATNEILSVFLISKSNCAFVNYKTEASCAAAMTRFHDSRFQGVRLVCRLRRTSVNAVSGVPTGPAALSSQQTPVMQTPLADGVIDTPDPAPGSDVKSPESLSVKDKYFIVKSLTVEDLEMSIRNGIWATQSHNEEALNKAYESADNVYLIFSANKSGEYFGYGRMTSPINEDPAAAIEFAPKAQTVENSDLPKAIQTEASEHAPKGRIIDDSARGTIFWEAEVDNLSDLVDGAEDRSDHSDGEVEASSSAKAWGKPFKLEWLSTNRLPFYRTRGLRNPWNSNREVKIARDGTELETSVGRRLIAMFHRDQSPVGPNIPVSMPIMGTYPQPRPY